MDNQWVIPENGYALSEESISFLGQGIAYVTAVPEDEFAPELQLLVAFSLPEQLRSIDQIGWFPLAVRGTGNWHRVEG